MFDDFFALGSRVIKANIQFPSIANKYTHATYMYMLYNSILNSSAYLSKYALLISRAGMQIYIELKITDL